MFVRALFILVVALFQLATSRVINKDLAKTLYTMSLKMPDVLPLTEDAYFCTAANVSADELYIRRFEPNADSVKIHHIIIFGCKDLSGRRTSLYPHTWPCSHANLCPGMRVLYAWGRNAPPLALPADVGLHIGARSEVNYLILQAHYAKPLAEKDSSGVDLVYTLVPQPYVAGIFLLASATGLIMPNKAKAHVDMNCRLGRDPIYVFAYRVHAHELGRVVSGYKYSPSMGNWTLLAKGNPQWPQSFFPMSSIIKIESEDVIHGRCTYDSTSRTEVTKMGPTAGDEMCNLYLMYFTKNKLFGTYQSNSQAFGSNKLNGQIQFLTNFLIGQGRKQSDTCEDKEVTNPQLLRTLPAGSDQPLQRNISLEEQADGSNHNHHFHHYSSGTKFGDQLLAQEETSSDNDEQVGTMLRMTVQPGWPFGPNVFGQITAVDIDASGRVVIFHRGRHVWNGRSFDSLENYLLIDEGPIDDAPIVIIDPKKQKVIDQWGAGFFYLPHGLTIDRKKRSIWLTDVALHQVFKFSLDSGSGSYRKPLLTLGERFKPGSDLTHFCKPTSIAVDHATDDFYVADGYCNSRVMRFDASGTFKNHFGHKALPNNGMFASLPPPNMLNVPHKVVLIENFNEAVKLLACIADRENGRIQCFDAPYGQFKFQIALEEFNGRVFSIAYAPKNRILYAVAGPSLVEQDKDVMAFGFSIDSQELVTVFAPESGTFSQPHDMAVTDDGDSVFVVEIGPNNLWLFTRADKVQTTSRRLAVPDIAYASSKPIPTILKPNRTISVIRSDIIPASSSDDEMSDTQFSFQMLKIRGKELREQVNLQYVIYILLVGLGIFIAALMKRHSSPHYTSVGFVGRMASSIWSSAKSSAHVSPGNGHVRPEKYGLSNLFNDRDRKLKRSGFNRLPQDESTVMDEEDDNDDDEEDVLEDFTLTRKNSQLV